MQWFARIHTAKISPVLVDPQFCNESAVDRRELNNVGKTVRRHVMYEHLVAGALHRPVCIGCVQESHCIGGCDPLKRRVGRGVVTIVDILCCLARETAPPIAWPDEESIDAVHWAAGDGAIAVPGNEI